MGGMGGCVGGMGRMCGRDGENVWEGSWERIGRVCGKGNVKKKVCGGPP